MDGHVLTYFQCIYVILVLTANNRKNEELGENMKAIIKINRYHSESNSNKRVQVILKIICFAQE